MSTAAVDRRCYRRQPPPPLLLTNAVDQRCHRRCRLAIATLCQAATALVIKPPLTHGNGRRESTTVSAAAPAGEQRGQRHHCCERQRQQRERRINQQEQQIAQGQRSRAYENTGGHLLCRKISLLAHFQRVNWPLNNILPRGEAFVCGEIGNIVKEFGLSKAQVSRQLLNYKRERFGQ